MLTQRVIESATRLICYSHTHKHQYERLTNQPNQQCKRQTITKNRYSTHSRFLGYCVYPNNFIILNNFDVRTILCLFTSRIFHDFVCGQNFQITREKMSTQKIFLFFDYFFVTLSLRVRQKKICIKLWFLWCIFDAQNYVSAFSTDIWHVQLLWSMIIWIGSIDGFLSRFTFAMLQIIKDI